MDPGRKKLELLRRRTSKTAAVTIDCPLEGDSLAAVIKKVIGFIDLVSLGIQVKIIKTTRAGGILFEVIGEDKAALLAEKVSEVTDNTARVRKADRRTPVLLLDIPEWADEDDVLAGLAHAGVKAEFKKEYIFIRKNGEKGGFVDLAYHDAIVLAEAKAATVAWTRCKIRLFEKSRPT